MGFRALFEICAHVGQHAFHFEEQGRGVREVLGESEGAAVLGGEVPDEDFGAEVGGEGVHGDLGEMKEVEEELLGGHLGGALVWSVRASHAVDSCLGGLVGGRRWW